MAPQLSRPCWRTSPTTSIARRAVLPWRPSKISAFATERLLPATCELYGFKEKIVVASTVEKRGPLAPSAAMAIELVRIRTAQQYPMLMPTLFPGDLATGEKYYVTLASMWTAFGDLKHNMSPVIDGDAFASAPWASSSHAPPPVAAPAASASVQQRHYSRPTRPSHTVSNVSHAHSRRDPFRVKYDLWPFRVN